MYRRVQNYFLSTYLSSFYVETYLNLRRVSTFREYHFFLINGNIIIKRTRLTMSDRRIPLEEERWRRVYNDLYDINYKQIWTASIQMIILASVAVHFLDLIPTDP